MSISTCIETITPEIAKEYLSHNTANRNLRGRILETMVRDMKGGNWKLTHQGIAFDSKGNLVDGQHRLTAIALSGVTVQMMVTRNVDDDAIMNIDTGAGRTVCDALKIIATKTGEDDPAIRHKGVIAAIRTLVYCGYNSNTKLSTEEVMVFMDKMDEQIHAVYKICLTRGKPSNGSVNAAVLAALLCGESVDSLRKFMSVFLLGDTKDCNELNTGAAFRLATVLMDAKIRHISLSKDKIYRLTENAIWQFLHGTETRLLREAKQHRYPVDILIKSIIGGKK